VAAVAGSTAKAAKHAAVFFACSACFAVDSVRKSLRIANHFERSCAASGARMFAVRSDFISI